MGAIDGGSGLEEGQKPAAREPQANEQPASTEERELERLRVQVRELTAQLIDARERSGALAQQRAALERWLKDSERRIEEASSDMSKRARRKLLAAREAVAEARSEVERETARSGHLEAKIEHLERALEQQREDAARRLAELDTSARRRISATQSEARDAIARVEKQAQAAVEERDAQLAHLRSESEGREGELSFELRETRQALEEARDKLREERGQLRQLGEQRSAAVEAGADARRERERYRREVEVLQAELVRLKQERSTLARRVGGPSSSPDERDRTGPPRERTAATGDTDERPGASSDPGRDPDSATRLGSPLRR